MSRRKGLGKGQGKGYKNIIGRDPMVHRQSAKGIKQPQQIKTGMLVKNRHTGKVGKVILKDKFAVKVYPIKKKSKIRGVFTNPKHWTTIRGEPLKVGKDFVYDSDGDAFPDGMDCSPTDPKKQDLKETFSKIEEKFKKLKEEQKEKQKEKRVSALKTIPTVEVNKLKKQKERVDEVRKQLRMEKDSEESQRLTDELDSEEAELREVQERVSNIKLEDLSDRQLETLAVNYRDDGLFSGVFGSGNEFQSELLRRQRKSAEIDREKLKIKIEEEFKKKRLKEDLKRESEEEPLFSF